MNAPSRSPASSRAPLVSVHRQVDEPVLVAVPLRPGTDHQALSRFGEDRWDLTPALFRENLSPTHGAIDFTGIDDAAQRLTAKEYLWARLNVRPPTGAPRAQMAPTIAAATLRYLVRFMQFVAQQTGGFDMARVDQRLLDAYLANERARDYRSAGAVARIIDAPIDLHRYAACLTLGGFSCRPWRGQPAARVAGCPSTDGENRTPRIPEPVVGALLRWSLKYLDLFAPDIFAARTELDALEHPSAKNRPQGSVRERLDAYVGRRCLEERGIPLMSTPTGGERRIDEATGERDPPINFALIAQQIGCTKMHLLAPDGPRVWLVRATRRLGGEIGGMDTPISIDPDTGCPWRERFDAPSLAHEEKMLQAACYVVCAYLTGMRDSEVQAMRTGCHRIERSADGLVERHRVLSLAYKGYGGRGLRAEWVTVEPVGRAIAVLEQLSARQRAHRGSEGLWLGLTDTAVSQTYLCAQATPLINRLRDHLDTMCDVGEASAIPHVDGRPWHFTTRQFRRTIAWYIANRPFGTVAGKIQYKHASIAMFEGYAGGSASGFRREVEQERALGQLDDIVEHYENARRSDRPTGPAATRLIAEFDHVADALGKLPGRTVDRQRLRTMLKHLARTLHVGFLNDCFFDPDTALCLDRSGTTDRSAPVLSHCSPDRCPNSCIARRHLGAWEESIAQADTLLRNKRLSPLQRRALTDDNARKRRLIAPLKEGPTP
jgi:hypothetical protein